jgi:hypothetical protein
MLSWFRKIQLDIKHNCNCLKIKYQTRQISFILISYLSTLRQLVSKFLQRNHFLWKMVYFVYSLVFELNDLISCSLNLNKFASFCKIKTIVQRVFNSMLLAILGNLDHFFPSLTYSWWKMSPNAYLFSKLLN